MFRDLPVLVVIFWLFFCLPILLGRSLLLAPFNVATVALGLNFSALMADILRAGYEAIPSGELEVARSFGFSRWRILRHIILPQAFWRSLRARARTGCEHAQAHCTCLVHLRAGVVL